MTFEADVTIEGDVRLTAPDNRPAVISHGIGPQGRSHPLNFWSNGGVAS